MLDTIRDILIYSAIIAIILLVIFIKRDKLLIILKFIQWIFTKNSKTSSNDEEKNDNIKKLNETHHKTEEKLWTEVSYFGSAWWNMVNLANNQNKQDGDANVAAVILILQRLDKLERENTTHYSAIFHN